MLQRLMLMLAMVFLFGLSASPQVHADTWAIYWYVCGSDLEDRYGAATNDFVEAANAEYSRDVTMVLQTGGTKRWDEIKDGSDKIVISPKHLERYLFNNNGTMVKIQRLPQGHMGRPKTLSDFLKYCLEHYPADHKVLIIWDHGGGSADNLSNDQNYHMEGLSLADVRQSLAEVFGNDPKTPPLDIIGFDACLMATLDVGMHVHKYAKYMVASEETEPGVGWNYTPMISKLSANSQMSARDFAKIICDTYLQGCLAEKEDGYDPSLDATLSVIDLAEIPAMKLAWNILGMEAVSNYVDQEADSFLTQLGRAADRSEKFLNSKSNGFSNMLDMGSFIKTMENQLPETSKEVYAQLQKTVIYRVSGEHHTKAEGLSCYHPFDGGKTFKNMLTETNLSPLVVLQGIKYNKLNGDQAEKYLLNLFDRISKDIDAAEQPKPEQPTPRPQPEGPGSLPSGVESVVSALRPGSAHQPSSLEAITSAIAQGLNALTLPTDIATQLTSVASIQPMANVHFDQLKDAPIAVDEKGDAVLNIGQAAMKYVESVYFYLTLFDKEKDVLIVLGKDADMYSDYEQGVFRSHFTNRWAALNDHVVSIEVTATDETSFYYTIPIKLNKQRVNLYARYDLEKSRYSIIGARTVLENDKIDKMLIKLKKGDEITTLFSACRLSDTDHMQEIEMDTFTLNDAASLEDTDMGDCHYAYLFEMNDFAGNSQTSDVALISVENGKITIEN